MVEERARLYEEPGLRQAIGPALRPGGLALTDRALALCALVAPARLLDIGCGPGVTVRHLAEVYRYTAIGLDLSASLLQVARGDPARLPWPALLQAPGERLPLAGEQFDAVLAECSLSVTRDPGRVLAECYRVLRPGGWLMISDIYARNPAGRLFLRQLPLSSCLSGAFSREEVAGLLDSAGFELVAWEDHSAALKQLAGQLILAGGSLGQVWGCPVNGTANLGDIQAAITGARPGYFLAVARK